MQIIQGTRSLPAPFPGSILTIGNFDGIHLGHQALIHRVVAKAKETGLPAVAMTFDPHPVKVLHPDRKLSRIFDLDDQIQEMTRHGLNSLVIEPFSREFSQLPPDRYLLEWIFRPFNPKILVVGYDFSFGANRQGSIEFLKERARELGFLVEVVAPVKIGDVLVSSSRIRTALESGEVELASRLLGRRFYLKGLVGKGVGRGRTIGVPTANLRTNAELVPKLGVYAAWAQVRNRRFKAAVNIGVNPTFNSVGVAGAQSVEAHLLLDANEKDGEKKFDIYGETLRLEFVDRLREERKFPNATELVAQIRCDIEETDRLLKDERAR